MENEIKVKVKNYQIIKEAEATFIPGLNIIVGPSNNGKTSFIKAIKSLLYTEPGSTPIRNGQSAYTVELTINNHNVKLYKGTKESYYEVDGTKYSKYGTSTPEEVSQALGIKELVLNGNKEQLNFWNQMDYPFLLDRSSTDLFRFIIDSGDNDKVSLALKDMVKDRQTIEGNIKQYQGNILMLDSQIEDLKNQTKDSSNIIKTCDDIIALREKINKLAQLEAIKDRILAYESSLITNKTRLQILNEETSKIYPLVQAILNKNTAINTIVMSKTRIDTLNNKLNQNKIILDKLKDIPKFNLDITKYINLQNKLVTIIRINQKLNNLSPIKLPSIDWKLLDISKIDNLIKVKTNIQTFEETILAKTNKLKQLDSSINEIKDIIKHIDICPLCGNKIDKKGIKLC